MSVILSYVLTCIENHKNLLISWKFFVVSTNTCYSSSLLTKMLDSICHAISVRLRNLFLHPLGNIACRVNANNLSSSDSSLRHCLDLCVRQYTVWENVFADQGRVILCNLSISFRSWDVKEPSILLINLVDCVDSASVWDYNRRFDVLIDHVEVLITC